MIKPPILKANDLVAIIAPASPFDPAALAAGVRALESLGLRIEAPVSRQAHYLAGSDAERLNEMNEVFANPAIKAVFCARGGYGSMRLLAQIKPHIFSQHPKIFVGYSDLTILLSLITHTCSMVSFHGPVVAKDLDLQAHPQTLAALKRALMDEGPLGKIAATDYGIMPVAIHPGQASGMLIGGNLTLLAHTLGTPFEIQTDGKILLLEDTGEKVYRLDRLLQHLKLAGKFKKVAGIVLADFSPLPEGETRSLTDLFQDVFADIEVPILYGFPAGHTREKVTLPLGVRAMIDADQGSLEFPESALTPI